jgi:hypothetical protein
MVKKHGYAVHYRASPALKSGICPHPKIGRLSVGRPEKRRSQRNHKQQKRRTVKAEKVTHGGFKA